MTGPGETGICQLPTHAELIGPAEIPPFAVRSGFALDAIVVPASRPAENLESVIGVAKGIGCHLVVLSSLRTDPAEVQSLLDKRGLTMGIVIEVPMDYDHPLFSFETTWWAREGSGNRVCAVRSSDLSIKRNIGLALARMLGWNHIFFIDDDMREITADAILGTVSLLGMEELDDRQYRTAGLAVKDYPDNSVVCHARRRIGEYQDVFVSGSVLAVDTSAPFDFFPDIYNEDWLFFYRDVARERLISSGFRARQLHFDPFDDPLRAAGQEFGDVIAEGLYALLHSKQGTGSADLRYWRMFLGDRSRILDDIIERLHRVPLDRRHAIGAAIGAARQTLREIRPDMCVQYIQAWRHDLERWGKRLETLPSVGSIEKALHELQLAPAARANPGIS